MKTHDKAYFELYNIKDDLSESNNFALKQPALVKKLSKLKDKPHTDNDKFKW